MTSPLSCFGTHVHTHTHTGKPRQEGDRYRCYKNGIRKTAVAICIGYKVLSCQSSGQTRNCTDQLQVGEDWYSSIGLAYRLSHCRVAFRRGVSFLAMDRFTFLNSMRRSFRLIVS
jgi:hypothetical protein